MNRISELRKINRLSQADLAGYVGCSQKAISNYENGSREIPYGVLRKLSEAFNCSTEYILGEINEKSPAAQGSEANGVSSFFMSESQFRRTQELNTIFLQLDDVGKAQLFAYAKFLEQQQSAAPVSQD